MTSQNPFDLAPSETENISTDGMSNKIDASTAEENRYIFDDPEDDSEEDSSIWIIQKAVWGIIKSITILVVIGLLVWFVWGDVKIPNLSKKFSWTNKTTSTKVSFEKRNKKIKEKEILPAKKKKPSIHKEVDTSEKNPGALLVRWSLWMHRTQSALTKNEIEKTLKWQKTIQNYFKTDILSRVTAPTLSERTLKVTQFEQQLQIFQNQGSKLVGILHVQKQTQQKKFDIARAELDTVSETLESKLTTKDYFGFESLLTKKQILVSQVEQTSSEIKIRDFLIQDIQRYQSYLQEIQIKLDANRTAILSDIKVTPFVNDPFKRLRITD
ncbi:hypothetical protein CSB37_00665 [bacterium DOLZORAL124_38_8]|nr:MAG: hypothetical protein CSB37_00665 [bacterium DOLZORAL124_38_8]